MGVTNISIKTNEEIKEQANVLFNELGLSMTEAINIFLKTAIKENRKSFNIRLDNVPNEETLEAMEESDRIAEDRNRKRYKTVQELREALEL